MQQVAHAADWQTISRAASRASAQLDYQTAIRFYELAIARVEEARELEEIVIDLKLCLADTFRRAGRLNDAVSVLNSLEARISVQGLSDPLLAARYWRRKADVESQLGKLRSASNALAHVCKVTENQLGSSSAEFEFSWHRYMDSLLGCNLDEFIHQLKLTYELSCPPATSQELRSYGRTALINCTHKALSGGRLESAKELLCALSLAGICDSESTILWYRFARQCQVSQKQDLIESAARHLELQSLRLSRIGAPAARRHLIVDNAPGERLACHCALACIYHVTGHSRQEDKQLEMIAQVMNLVPVEVLRRTDPSLCCDSFNRVVTAARLQGVSMKKFESLCLRVLTVTQEGEPGAPICCNRAYVLSLSTLCVLYMKRGELDRAEAILRSVDPRKIAVLAGLRPLVPGLYSRLAVLYSSIGKDDKASACREEACQLAARIQSAQYRVPATDPLGIERAHQAHVHSNRQGDNRLGKKLSAE